MSQNIDKFRSRTFNFVLYPEDVSHVSALEKIKLSFDYAFILHDKDLEENGELKKPHWHVTIRHKNAIWNTALAKELGIGENYIQQCKNLKNSLQYLVHYNDKNKFQYELNEVYGSLKTRLVQSINDEEKTEGEKVNELLEILEDCNNIIKVSDFAKYCAKNGYWSEFRRSASIFIRIIDEHNQCVIRDASIDENIKRRVELEGISIEDYFDRLAAILKQKEVRENMEDSQEKQLTFD